MIERLGCPEPSHGLTPSGLKRGIGCRRTCWKRAYEQIIPSRKQRLLAPKELAQPPLYPIPHHGYADGLAHSKPEASDTFPPVVGVDAEITRAQPPPLAVTARKVRPSGKAFLSAQTLVHLSPRGLTGHGLCDGAASKPDGRYGSPCVLGSRGYGAA
jgi:hypothetical protein